MLFTLGAHSTTVLQTEDLHSMKPFNLHFNIVNTLKFILSPHLYVVSIKQIMALQPTSSQGFKCSESHACFIKLFSLQMHKNIIMYSIACCSELCKALKNITYNENILLHVCSFTHMYMNPCTFPSTNWVRQHVG